MRASQSHTPRASRIDSTRPDRRFTLVRPVLLMICGLVVGMFVQVLIAPAVGLYGMIGGLAGISTFAGLDCILRRNREKSNPSRYAHTTQNMEERIRRHIPRAPHMQTRSRARTRTRTDIAPQYLTVVRSRRNW